MSTTTVDDNPRPHKRTRISPSQTSESTPTPPPSTAAPPLRPLPTPLLLLTLPSLLLHPPNHRHHLQSLALSVDAARKCVALTTLDPDIECHAWTTLAELGLIVMNGEFHLSQRLHPWAKDIDIEVEKAISKGLVIAKKHPSLRAYKFTLTLLNARLCTLQHPTNPKPTRTILRRLLSSLSPSSDPPHVIYTVHLALFALHTQDRKQFTKSDIAFALTAIDEMHAQAQQNAHADVCVLARVLRLRMLVSAGLWGEVEEALKIAELALRLEFPNTHPNHNSNSNSSTNVDSNVTSSDTTPTPADATQPAEQPSEQSAFIGCMMIHTLILGIVFHTHVGGAANASERLARLHAMLDSGALDKFPQGIVEIQFAKNAPLALQMTHPRVLYLLAFLVSATAKRDPVGRRPKRWVFATEGLAAWERGMGKAIELPRWAGVGDMLEIEKSLVCIKADLLSELIGVSIMRSEFDEAEQTLDTLIAHTRTHGIFPAFAARITLHHAHLAHALGGGARALECYGVAAYLAEKEMRGGGGGGSGAEFVRVAARAGEVALRFGICAGGGMRGERRGDEDGEEWEEEEEGLNESEELKAEEMAVREMGAEVVKECRGLGGALESVGAVLEACLSSEVLKAKQHLKKALGFASQAQDNQMRALVLALISAHYVHTSGTQAREILKTCEQLAAGLGVAKGKKKGDPGEKENGIGNAPLRLWIGERLVELDRRGGDVGRANKQEVANRRLVEAIRGIARRGTEEIKETE